MSALIAVDPNVLLGVTLADRHCTWAIQGLSERAAELCLALDDQGVLFKTYYGIQERLLADNVTKTFIEMFLNARQRRQRIRGAGLSDGESRWLAAELNLKEPVEPELIAVGKAAPGRPIVVVVGKEGLKGEGIRERATNSPQVIDRLHEKYRSLCICPAQSVPRQLGLIERSRYPGAEDELIAYIRGVETEFVEFKQPHKQNSTGHQIPSPCLTQSIIKEALESVCAMLNCEGGKVFVGITPAGQVTGIDPPATMASGTPDDDALSRKFTDQYKLISPTINEYVKPAIIPLSNGRRVVALHVEPPKKEKGVRFAFWDHSKREWWEIDRCGPSNKRTRVVHGLPRPT